MRKQLKLTIPHGEPQKLDEVNVIFDDEPQGFQDGAYNKHNSLTISGTEEAVRQLAEKLEDDGLVDASTEVSSGNTLTIIYATKRTYHGLEGTLADFAKQPASSAQITALEEQGITDSRQPH